VGARLRCYASQVWRQGYTGTAHGALLFMRFIVQAHARAASWSTQADMQGKKTACLLQGLWIDFAALARALTAKQLPHLKWSDRKPPLLEFMVHAELSKA